MNTGENKITEIDKEFTYKGENFVRVFENGEWYIYRRDHYGTFYYEVFMKKVVDKIDFDTKVPTGEKKFTYPKDDHFGRWAWCCKSLESAMKYVS